MKKVNSMSYPLREKRAYASPQVDLLITSPCNSLLNNFSGDIEGWEDDEVITPQG